MTTWTVGEGRSSPQTFTATRMAAEDEARSAWLDSRLKAEAEFARQVVAEERQPPKPKERCWRGHRIDGLKSGGPGRPFKRYCKHCHRIDQAARKARRAG